MVTWWPDSKTKILAGKKRASRLFGNLLATLRTFDEKVKTESVAEKRAEIDKKVDERIATDRRKILEEKRALMQKKNEKERLLGLLQEKQGFGDLVCLKMFIKDSVSR